MNLFIQVLFDKWNVPGGIGAIILSSSHWIATNFNIIIGGLSAVGGLILLGLSIYKKVQDIKYDSQEKKRKIKLLDEQINEIQDN